MDKDFTLPIGKAKVRQDVCANRGVDHTRRKWAAVLSRARWDRWDERKTAQQEISRQPAAQWMTVDCTVTACGGCDCMWRLPYRHGSDVKVELPLAAVAHSSAVICGS